MLHKRPRRKVRFSTFKGPLTKDKDFIIESGFCDIYGTIHIVSGAGEMYRLVDVQKNEDSKNPEYMKVWQKMDFRVLLTEDEKPSAVQPVVKEPTLITQPKPEAKS